MPTETTAQSRSTTGDTLLALGWIAVLTPVVYMAAVGWGSGEHGGTVILFGLIATLFQLAVWGSGWMITRHKAPVARRVAFGAGATTSLVISLLVLAVTVSPAWAVTTYGLLASLPVAIVGLSPGLGAGRRRPDRW